MPLSDMRVLLGFLVEAEGSGKGAEVPGVVTLSPSLVTCTGHS